MLKIEETEVNGFKAAIRGMRNPLNSWDKSDSGYPPVPTAHNGIRMDYIVGQADLKLMQRLCKAGTDHRKFMRMITVSFDITAPLYWWKEYDTYKVGTVANSCSTMHKIQSRPLTMEDFSTDHLSSWDYTTMEHIVSSLNHDIEEFNETKDKEIWYSLIQMLPSSYNQKRTVTLNYEVLRNIYFSRRSHKLDEWHTFCDWVHTLPYADELICNEFKD